MQNSSIRLPDGRTLSYTIYGHEAASPVFYFHGTPSSRLEPTIVSAYGINLEILLSRYRLRIIAVDRPGSGLSSLNPSGDFISFANDIFYLKQVLKIGRCKLLCWSGGGPFALAMAYTYPAEVQAVYIITAFSIPFNNTLFKKMHLNKFYFGAAKHIPKLMRLVMNVLLKKKIKRSLPRIVTGLPKVDYDLISGVEKLSHVAEATTKEACVLDSRGAVYEAALYFKDFGFKLTDIKQPIHFWWGSQDNAVIREHAEAVEKTVANSIMHYKQNEGHLSVYINCFEEVLKTMANE